MNNHTITVRVSRDMLETIKHERFLRSKLSFMYARFIEQLEQWHKNKMNRLLDTKTEPEKQEVRKENYRSFVRSL